jgi:hypothetical protein
MALFFLFSREARSFSRKRPSLPNRLDDARWKWSNIHSEAERSPIRLSARHIPNRPNTRRPGKDVP